jgi:hypothetical protein
LKETGGGESAPGRLRRDLGGVAGQRLAGSKLKLDVEAKGINRRCRRTPLVSADRLIAALFDD